MYWLKKGVEIDFGIVKDYQVAERIGITNQTLCKILKRKTGCSKPIANYITYLNESTYNRKYNDKKIDKYFCKKG